MTNKKNNNNTTNTKKQQGEIPKKVPGKVKTRKSEIQDKTSTSQPTAADIPEEKPKKKTVRRRRKPATKKLTERQMLIQTLKSPTKARAYFILFLGVLIVFVYGLLAEGAFSNLLKENQGVIIIFLFFIVFQFILIIFGYQLGLSKNSKNRRKK